MSNVFLEFGCKVATAIFIPFIVVILFFIGESSSLRSTSKKRVF